MCHSKEDQQQFQGVKSYINSPNNAALKNNNNPPPTQDNNDPPIEEIWHFASSLLPFETCKPDFSFRSNPNHPQHLRLQRPRPTKKRTWKTWPAWQIFVDLFLVNFYKKKVSIMLVWRVFLIYTWSYLFQRFLPSKLGQGSQTLTQFPSFFLKLFETFS